MVRWVLFNVTVKENIDIAEYDVIQWNEQDKSILFIEYKNSVQAYKNLKAHEAQQNKIMPLTLHELLVFKI